MWFFSEALNSRRLLQKIADLERTMEIRTKEYEQHINTVRKERDGAMKALDQARKWADEIAALFEKDIPSITEQTSWACGIFDFRMARVDGTDYFNPGLVEIDGVLWLLARRARNLPGVGPFGMNDLVSFELEGLLPKRGTVLKLQKYRSDQQFEDPRIVLNNGKLYVSYTTFVVFGANKFSYAHQSLSVLDRNWKVTKTYEPEYGHNKKHWLSNKGFEKNWLWFFWRNDPMLLYLTKPHTVVSIKFGVPADQQRVFVTHEVNPLWVHGEPRGGTPPVLVDGEYWTFFHSSVPWTKTKRRYNMGAYAFEANPPFRITKMTSLPLLSGSRRDPWGEGKPLVVFPCGALMRDGEWLVTLGVNDLACAWIKIPHADLIELVQSVNQANIELVT